MSTSCLEIVTDAYDVINVLGEGEVLSAELGERGRKVVNQVLDQWSLMPLTIPVTAREVFPLTGGRGGPSDPYTIGPGGDFDTSRPTSITSVGLLVTATSQPFEITRAIYTNDAYASIVQKELTSSYFTGLYYNATFAGGLGQINLWPVPSDASTSLVLYRLIPLRTFPLISTAYDFPPGAVSALTYETAKWLAPRMGRAWTDDLQRLADRTLAVYQRGNTVMTDLGLDPALTAQAGVYNILSDSSSGQSQS
jgi:hypothetical protein